MLSIILIGIQVLHFCLKFTDKILYFFVKFIQFTFVYGQKVCNLHCNKLSSGGGDVENWCQSLNLTFTENCCWNGTDILGSE